MIDLYCKWLTLCCEVVASSLAKHGQRGEATHNRGLAFCWHGNCCRVHVCSGGVLYTFVLYSVTSVLLYIMAFPGNQLNII